MKKKTPLIVLLLVLVLLAVTKPSEEQHRKATGEAFGKQNKLAGALGVGRLYSGLYDYHDYVFCSATTFDGKLRSIGVLGVVITL